MLCPPSSPAPEGPAQSPPALAPGQGHGYLLSSPPWAPPCYEILLPQPWGGAALVLVSPWPETAPRLYTTVLGHSLWASCPHLKTGHRKAAGASQLWPPSVQNSLNIFEERAFLAPAFSSSSLARALLLLGHPSWPRGRVTRGACALLQPSPATSPGGCPPTPPRPLQEVGNFRSRAFPGTEQPPPCLCQDGS